MTIRRALSENSLTWPFSSSSVPAFRCDLPNYLFKGGFRVVAFQLSRFFSKAFDLGFFLFLRVANSSQSKKQHKKTNKLNKLPRPSANDLHKLVPVWEVPSVTISLIL